MNVQRLAEAGRDGEFAIAVIKAAAEVITTLIAMETSKKRKNATLEKFAALGKNGASGIGPIVDVPAKMSTK